MKIDDIIEKRGIAEVVHFTTKSGVFGTIAKKMLLATARLKQDEYLFHILRLNWDRWKDEEWLDHANLSITSANLHLLDRSKRRHAGDDIWWCILSFDPEILTHENVVFATTNNIYTGVKRGSGANGLEALFARRVVQYLDWNGSPSKHAERTNQQENETTCPQAEVLYPAGVPFEYVRKIYVADEEHGDQIHGQCRVFDLETPEIVVKPELFL